MKLSILIGKKLAIFAFLLPGVVQAQNEIIVRTDNFIITENDFYRYLTERGINEEQREQVLSREGAIRNIFDNLYTIKAFAEKGLRNSQIDMDEVQWMVDHYRERLLMQRQVALEVDENLSDVDWEALALEEFKAREEEFIIPERINADHILISIQNRTKSEALEIAKEVQTRLEEGEEFAELVKEYSDDTTSAERGGSLGNFPRGQMVKPFEEAAFVLEEGQISDIVETSFGYHIIRLVDRLPEQIRSFDQVKDQLVERVKERRREQVRSDIISEMRSGAADLGLEVNLEALEAIEAQFESPGSTNPLVQ